MSPQAPGFKTVNSSFERCWKKVKRCHSDDQIFIFASVWEIWPSDLRENSQEIADQRANYAAGTDSAYLNSGDRSEGRRREVTLRWRGFRTGLSAFVASSR